MRRIFPVVFLIAAFVVGVNAQSNSGTLLGTVRDATKVLIPGVQITLTNLQTRQTYKNKTNESGEYKFEIPAGLYSVTAELPGFVTVALADVRVNQAVKRLDPITLAVDRNSRPPSVERGVIPIPLAPTTTPRGSL